MTLQDFLVRRVSLSETGTLSYDIIHSCADEMARQFQWSETRKARERASFGISD